MPPISIGKTEAISPPVRGRVRGVELAVDPLVLPVLLALVAPVLVLLVLLALVAPVLLALVALVLLAPVLDWAWPRQLTPVPVTCRV